LDFSDLSREQLGEILYNPDCILLLELGQDWMEKRNDPKWQNHIGKFLLTIMGIRHMQGFESTITFKLEPPVNLKNPMAFGLTDPGGEFSPS
jgi:hypothetical protein